MITSVWRAARSPNIVLMQRGDVSLVSDIAEFAACDCSPCPQKNALMTRVHESALTLGSGADLLSVCGRKAHRTKLARAGGRIRGQPAKL